MTVASQLGFSDTLPVFDFYDTIVDAVDQNQVTIITAETGAGKSTQVPQYLAEHGYSKVIVTQPRILAARNLSRRVREEYAIRTGKDGDDRIGYRTAHERDDSPRTQILYCTDGLQLVREITERAPRNSRCLYSMRCMNGTRIWKFLWRGQRSAAKKSLVLRWL